MKKFLTIFISIFIIVFGAIGLSACGSDGHSGNSNSVKRYNDNITYKLSYTSEEECPNGNIVDGKLHSSTGFEVGKVYYMVVDFTISSFNAEGWDNSFSSSVKISPSEVISATLEEAATGNFTENEENGGVNITTTYSIPENRTEARSYRFVVQLKLKETYNWARAELFFYGDGESIDCVIGVEELIIYNATRSLEYELNETGYTVTGGYNKYSLTSLLIPKEYNNKPVTSIADGAFSSCAMLRDIYIPQSITSIGASAFSNCSGLTSVEIPNSVTLIGGSVFSYCNNLETITVQKGNAFYHSVDNCIIDTENKALLSGCKNSVIPNDGSVNWIRGGAFSGFSFTSIELPDGIIYIDSFAFIDCHGITSIEIPKSVTAKGGDSFGGCINLENIIVQNGNPVYHSDGNCVIETASRTLIAGCKNSVIPDDGSVTSIFYNAFYYCAELKSITIPESVSSIYSGAFFGCYNLTSVTFNNVFGWTAIRQSNTPSVIDISNSDLTDSANAANLLTSTYNSYNWTRS